MPGDVGMCGLEWKFIKIRAERSKNGAQFKSEMGKKNIGIGNVQ